MFRFVLVLLVLSFAGIGFIIEAANDDKGGNANPPNADTTKHVVTSLVKKEQESGVLLKNQLATSVKSDLSNKSPGAGIYADSSNYLQNLVIFVKDDVKEGDGTLLNNIKTYITETSKALWTATGKMDPKKAAVQFGNVFIVIPSKWKATSNQTITWQRCSKADILVTTNKENQNQNEPYTKQTGKCGEPAEFIRIPHSFLTSTDSKQIKIKGKTIMSEFVKLRYGVFSEKAYRNQLIIYDGNAFVQSSCASDIKLKLSKPLPVCSEQDNDCTYTIDTNGKQTHSVMFDQTMDTIDSFCGDSTRPHNILAMSLQNIKCKMQGITDVILKHDDFKTNKVSPNFVNPTFTIVKAENRKIVLVLDVSGSMRDIISNMKLAATEYVRNVIEDSASLGLVNFSDDAAIISPLLSMDNPANKDKLINAINSLSIIGSTNIPAGLRKGIEALGGTMSTDKLFGTIFLLTDGANNMEPNNWNNNFYINIIKTKGIMVNTISYGTGTDQKLELLASSTGGKFVYADPSLSYTNLMNIFALRAACDNFHNVTVKVTQGQNIIDLTSTVSDVILFYADKFMGKNLYLTVSLNQSLTSLDIKLVDPSNKEYGYVSSQQEASGTTLVFKIAGDIEVGNYRLRVRTISKRFRRTLNQGTMTAAYIVSAMINPDLSRVVHPTGHLSQSEIQSVDSTTTVLVTVDLSTCGMQKNDIVMATLSLTHPQQKTIERQLLDNGLGCDSIGGDQIYSTCLYAKDLTKTEFYGLSAQVKISPSKSESIDRAVDLGSLNVKDIAPNIVDKIPPATIQDIKMVIVNEKERILTIETLATGDDGVTGNINRYQIKVDDKKRTATIIEVTSASAALKPISFTVNLYNATSSKPFGISIRGIDLSGNMGEWSNEKMFSWRYNEDKKKYGGFGSKNYCKPLFMVFCLIFIRILHV